MTPLGKLPAINELSTVYLYAIVALLASTASVACIGGSASAPIIATAYDGSFAGIGVLMGILGVALGNFFGLGMGTLLHLITRL